MVREVIEIAAELQSLLAGGPLDSRPVYAIEWPRSGERVLTVPAQPSELLDEWKAAPHAAILIK